MREAESEAKHLHPEFGCREFRAELEDYIDGEDRPAVPDHASRCEPCRVLLADFEAICSAAHDLMLETPPPGMWNNIRAELTSEGLIRQPGNFWERWMPRRKLAWSLAGAGATAAIAAGLVISSGSLHRRAAEHSPLVARMTSPTSLARKIDARGYTSVQANLTRTIGQMETAYRAREASLDPSMKQTYDKGLSSLDSSIHECLVSLEQQPHNALTRQYLMQAYAAKADVLASALEYDSR